MSHTVMERHSRQELHGGEIFYGGRFLEALERFGVSLDPLRETTLEWISHADRSGLVHYLKRRHGILPHALEGAIRTQDPEALAFRLAGDPRLLQATFLLAQ